MKVRSNPDGDKHPRVLICFIPLVPQEIFEHQKKQ